MDPPRFGPVPTAGGRCGAPSSHPRSGLGTTGRVGPDPLRRRTDRIAWVAVEAGGFLWHGAAMRTSLLSHRGPQRPVRRRPRRRGFDLPAAAVALALVAGAASACAGGDGSTEPVASTRAPAGSAGTTAVPPTSPGTTAPPATAAPATDEEAVLAAVNCYWSTIVAANDPPDPDHPGFDRCFTGAALERSRERVQEHLIFGQTVRDPSGGVQRTAPTITVEGNSARATQCAIDDAVVVRTDTGEVLNDKVVSTEVQLILERTGTSWKVTDSVLLSKTDGPDGCRLQ